MTTEQTPRRAPEDVQEMAQELEHSQENAGPQDQMVLVGDTPVALSDLGDRIGVQATSRRPNRNVMVYHRASGLPRLIPRSVLNDALEAVDENGAKVFTTDVMTAVLVGNLKCELHADSERRATWDSLGLKYCTKDGILSKFDQVQHLSRYHKDEEKIIQDHAQAVREAEIKEEMMRDRAHREQTLTAMTDIAAAAAGTAATAEVPPHRHFFAPKAKSCAIFECDEQAPPSKSEAGK